MKEQRRNGDVLLCTRSITGFSGFCNTFIHHGFEDTGDNVNFSMTWKSPYPLQKLTLKMAPFLPWCEKSFMKYALTVQLPMQVPLYVYTNTSLLLFAISTDLCIPTRMHVLSGYSVVTLQGFYKKKAIL